MNVIPTSMLTSVKVLQGIPLDSSQTDTLKFSSVSDQISYFTSKAKDTFLNLTPCNMNTLRMPKPADYFYNCNYIMFQNANFNNKWFYAFIKEIKYKSLTMSEITIEIDDLQTWQFDWDIKPSMIIREHSLTDNVGDNMVAENIDIGYYKEETAEKTPFFNNYSAIIATSYDGTETPLGGYVGGLFTGLKYIQASVDMPEQVEGLVNLLDLITKANKSDAITSIFMMPSNFFTNGDIPVSKRFDATKQQTKLGSYTPKNKKLLTYPYNFLYVFTPDGASSIYRYEFFQNPNSCGFNLLCAMSCNPEIVLEPIAYQKQQFNLDESMTMGGFPQCAYSIDSFKAFLAQNTSAMQLSMLGSAVGVASSVATGNPVGAVLGGIGAMSTINSMVMASQKPPQIRGQQGTSTFTGTREKNFYFVNKHVSEEYAKIIDDYFNMYGYATNRVKVPNLTGRPYWNYVQTENVKILGSIPFDSIERIKEIFNRGITFWHTKDVGNYNLNNSV